MALESAFPVVSLAVAEPRCAGKTLTTILTFLRFISGVEGGCGVRSEHYERTLSHTNPYTHSLNIFSFSGIPQFRIVNLLPF